MRKRLLYAALAVAVLSGVWVSLIEAQGVQCGGSFVPSLNCTISGRWYFTNQTTAAATTSQGPIPFQVKDQNSNPVDVTGIVSRVTDLTDAQVLTLGSTPVTVVPAPGAGYYVDVIGVTVIFNYTATYSNGANMALFYGTRQNALASASITASGLLTSVSADHMFRATGTTANSDIPVTNVAVVFGTLTGVNFTGGNAANSVRVVVNYRIVKTGL